MVPRRVSAHPEKTALVLVVLAICAGSAFFLPTRTQNISFRHFKTGVSVSVARTSPPLAALEDEKLALEIANEPEAKVDDKLSKSTQAILANVQIQREQEQKTTAPRDLKPLSVAKTTTLPRQIFLTGLTITRTDPNVVNFLNESQRSLLEQSFASTLGEQRKVGLGEGDAKTPSGAAQQIAQQEVFTRSLPTHLRSRIERVKDLSALLNNDYSEPTALEKAQEVAMQTPPPAVFSGGSVVKVTSVTQSSPPASHVRGAMSVSPQSLNSPRLIQGLFEMKNGLAYLGEDQVFDVYQLYQDSPITYGSIEAKSGTFSITVDDSVGGEIVVELRDKRGGLLGQGRSAILPRDVTTRSGKGDLVVSLEPIPDGVWGRVTSAYSFNKSVQAVKDAQVTIDELKLAVKSSDVGSFSKPGLLPGSTFLLRARHQDHWGAISLTSNTHDSNLTLYPNKMITAFRSLLDVSDSAQSGGLIWGRAIVGGHPVGGVKIQLSTADAVGPIYFNALQIPDKTLETTSENGLYAYLMVEPGVHVLKGTIDGKQSLPPKVVVTEPHFVSTANLETSTKNQALVKVFDALTGDPLDGQVNFLGSDKLAITRGGRTSAKYSRGSDLLFVDVDANLDYPISRVSQSRDVSEIQVPMIQQNWLARAASSERISINPDLSTVVGFIRGAPFTVNIDQKAPAETEVIFFDSSGEVIRGATRGPENGGFMVINAPTGLRTIVIQNAKTRETMTQTALCEPNIVNVISERIN